MINLLLLSTANFDDCVRRFDITPSLFHIASSSRVLFQLLSKSPLSIAFPRSKVTLCFIAINCESVKKKPYFSHRTNHPPFSFRIAHIIIKWNYQYSNLQQFSALSNFSAKSLENILKFYHRVRGERRGIRNPKRGLERSCLKLCAITLRSPRW